jgi:hypothetical protein
VRASGGAAVGVVTELVNVESTLGVGVVAGDVPGDGGRGALVSLLKGDGAGDLGVTTEDSNCRYKRSMSYSRRSIEGQEAGPDLPSSNPEANRTKSTNKL